MVERLILGGTHLGRDLPPPFFRIGEDGIDIVDDAAKRVDAVFHHLANAEFSNPRFHRFSYAFCNAGWLLPAAGMSQFLSQISLS
jgi:hypothetical protein